MSKLSTNSFFSGLSALSPEEDATAREEFNRIKDSLERKTKVTFDNLMIAGSLCRMRDKHGRNSNIYNNFINALTEVDDCWNDKFFRLRWVEAYRGYESIAGSDADKEFIFKLNPSASALKSCQFLPGDKCYRIIKELKSVESFPSAAAVERYGKTGNFNTKASLPTPREESKDNSEVVIDPIIDVQYVAPERSTIERPNEMMSANTTADIAPVQQTMIQSSPTNTTITTTTTPTTVTYELSTIYQALESVVLSKRHEIQDNPEALAVLQWMTDLNHNYFNIDQTVGRR